MNIAHPYLTPEVDKTLWPCTLVNRKCYNPGQSNTNLIRKKVIAHTWVLSRLKMWGCPLFGRLKTALRTFSPGQSFGQAASCIAVELRECHFFSLWEGGQKCLYCWSASGFWKVSMQEEGGIGGGWIRHNKAIRLRPTSPAPIWLIQEIEETAQ